MITLITGAPGAGKTSALVKLLSELAKGRVLYVDGIPDLKVPHVALEDARKWPELVPDGAAIVIDEAQRVWRPAGPGQRVAPDIAMLETHRHRGLDFFIVTQHPKLLHTNVRNLVGRHVHLRDIGVLGRWWYEWPEAVDPGTWKSAPVKKRYRLDRGSFKLYKSASEHVKPIRSVPPVVYVLGAAVLLAGGLGWYVMRTIGEKSGMVATPAPAASAAGSGALASVFGGASAGNGARFSTVTGASMVASFVPRLAHDPGSAPAFDDLRMVRVMPRVIGGYCQGGECYCYTQQGTDAGIGDKACRAWIAAPPFDPYREARTEQGGRAGDAKPAQMITEVAGGS